RRRHTRSTRDWSSDVCSSDLLAHDSVGLVILWSCITSVGVGAAFAAIPNLIVGAVDVHETGEATGVNTVMRNIGSAVGAQVAGRSEEGRVGKECRCGAAAEE